MASAALLYRSSASNSSMSLSPPLGLPEGLRHAETNPPRPYDDSAVHGPHGSRLSTRNDRTWTNAVSAPGKWQPGRKGRQGDRLRADRPEFLQPEIFPRAAFGHFRAGSGRFHPDAL